ncbi:MAG: hypothetical protein ACFE75_04145 [Candidatus Hodarchaeota archaeon]
MQLIIEFLLEEVAFIIIATISGLFGDGLIVICLQDIKMKI